MRQSLTAYQQLQRHVSLTWYPISISAVIFCLFSTFGLAAGQVQEALANYVADPQQPWSSFEWRRLAITFVAVFILASTMRYWTARLVGVDMRGLHIISALNGWQKAFIGVAWFAPWIGASLSFTDAALSLQGAHAEPSRTFIEDFVYLARALVTEPLHTPFTVVAAGALVAPGLFLAVWWSPLARLLHRLIGHWPIVRATHAWLLPMLFAGLTGLFLFMPGAGIDLAREIGPVAIVCVGFAAVTAAGAYLIHFGRRHGVPTFPLAAAAPLLLGAIGLDDNNYVRELGTAPLEVERPTASEALRAFEGEVGGGPIILVSAEGSGIRAAQFSSAILARLADQCPRLARRIFAISGVSGGAVGAAAYRASLEVMPLQGSRCDLDASRPAGPRESALNAMFSQDHLSPILAKQMFPELLQTFLPASERGGHAAFAPQTDRQLGLELSLEQAFAEAFGLDRNSSPFAASAFAHTDAAPHLFMNMTEAVSGGVYVASTLDLANMRTRHPWLHDFRCLWSTDADAENEAACDVSPDFRLSTLAASSARFPIVSPAGTVRVGERAFRFVDGGYFDNSGVETLMGVIEYLQREARETGRSVPPIAVLHIDSNPYVLRLPVKWRLDFDIHELQAVLSTREERVRISLDRLQNLQHDGRLCSVRFVEVQNNRVPLRLGWILSEPAAEELEQQAATQLEVAFPGARPPICDGEVSRALHAANERAGEEQTMREEHASE